MRLPLTAAQAGIWAGQRLDPTSPAYNAAEYVELRGPLDVAAFESAVRRAVAEAPALHCRFSSGTEQWTAPVDDWSLRRIRCADLTAAQVWMGADLATPVDLATGPLFAQVLVTIGPEHHLWYQRIHHIAADGYAFALLAQRVADLYTAAVAGEPVRGKGFGPLEPVVDEDSAYSSSERRERDRVFWGDYLASSTAATLAPGKPMAAGVRRHRVRLTGPVEPGRVLAATALLLHRETGDSEAVVGLPVMGRLGSAALRVPCMAMNIVPIRVPLPAGATLREVSALVDGELRRTRPHHRYRYEQLRRDLGLVGGDRRLFGPVVNLMPFDYRLRFAGLDAISHGVSAGPVEDLSIAVSDRGRGPVLELDANPAAYSAAALAAIAAALVDLLTGDPDRQVVAPATVLDGGPPAPARSVVELIDAVDPGRIAVVDQVRGDIRYAELRCRARDIADRLTSLGAGPGRVVAVSLPRGAEAVASILGVLYTGAGYLPVDPDAPTARTAALLDDARPVAVVGPDGLVGCPSPAAHDPQVAYVMYTSGSTGTPNGVVVARPALDHFVAGATHRYAITADDRVLQFAPLHFDASVEEIFPALCAGATVVVRTERMLDSMGAFVDGLAAKRVTVVDLPTAFWHELAYAALPMPPSVRAVIIGGEAALAERVERWHRSVGPDVTLFNTYGPTEATVVATVASLVPGAGTPIGLPLPGVRCTIVDGELLIGGGGLASGYLHRPELTSRRFVEISGERWYRTGDRVRVGGDGQLVFAGRVDDEFKISGHRVDPAEIESVLLRHPDVADAAVIGHVDGAARRLVAHVVLSPDALSADGAFSADKLRRHVAAVLPAAVVPGTFVHCAHLPRTPNGKVDRAALRRVAVPAATSEIALTPAQARVAAVWREVLGVAEVAHDDDFFALGGQSLQTIQVANRLGVPVPTVFGHPTVASLASALLGGGSLARASFVDDAVLPASVVPRAPAGAGRVLLTGATGFVGAYLLAELLRTTDHRVACLVRAPGEAAALDRVREALVREALLGHELSVPLERVDAVPGTLELPYTGPEVDAVYHCAASVSVVRGYSSLKLSNVDGTARLLALGVPFHHISTVAVSPSASFVPPHDGLRDGYQQSKWVAEELVRQAGERGVPVAVYRLGRVVGDVVNASDLVWRILRAGVPRGVLPDLDVAEPWTPVDWVARTVVRLAGEGFTGVRPLVPVRPTRLREVFGWVDSYGYPVDVVPLDDWLARVRVDADDADLATLAFFAGPQAGASAAAAPPSAPPAAAASSAAGPAGEPDAPVIGRDDMYRYLDAAVITGLLPKPPSMIR